MRLPKLGKILAGTAICGALGAAAITIASCSATPTPVAVRTFERAGRMDVVCLKISEAGLTIPPVPVAQANCAPVADGTDTTLLPYHLYALVTQTLRGEVAVVDLTASHVVDVSRTQPGVNFIPVGNNPTDIVAAADGSMVFVASAEVNKPAIYAIAGANVLGDALGIPGATAPRIVDLPVCALPQAPSRMLIIPGTPIAADAGTGEAGADGGSPTTTSPRLAVLLPGDSATPAKLVTVDTTGFSDGSIGPGSLAPCKITSAITLSSKAAASWSAGPTWGNGIPYVDGGVDLFAPSPGTTDVPQLPLWAIGRKLATPDAGDPDAGSTDAAIDGSSDGSTEASSDAAAEASVDAGADAESFAVKMVPGNVAHGRSLAFDGRMIYVGDDALPLIHVVDTANGALNEIEPYLATSLANPARIVTTTEVGVSPVTHDFKRYLYALDDRDGSIIVFDATDPLTAKRSPMVRPNPELVPAQAPDRIRFAQPITAFSFVRHDLPLDKYPLQQPGVLKTGLQCNPNRGVEHGKTDRTQGPFSTDEAGTQFNDVTLGAYYRANYPLDVGLGPGRLRGIFALVTLSNGFVSIVDVDDWDAACRRPEALAVNFQNSSLQIPQVNDTEFDPYHWSDTGSLGSAPSDVDVVTREAFFPISPPNRARSVYLLKNDPTTGNHAPYVLGSFAQLLENGAPVDANQRRYPRLYSPTAPWSVNSGSAKPDGKVLLSFEDPTVHVDQDWTLVHEGALPGFDGIAGTLSSPDDFKSIQLGSTSALFCRRGVEDLRVSSARVAAIVAEEKSGGDPDLVPPRLADRVADYVQITDDIMFATDPYWSLTDANGQPPSCWDVPLDGSRNLKTEPAAVRQQVCSAKFGLASAASAQRDFPILEAYDDHLVLGRYLYSDTNLRPTNGRVIAPRDTESQIDFKLAQCCFHNQAHFRVRAGGQWLASGSVAGYLHHISADANHACVQSSSSREVLLNARMIERLMKEEEANGGAIPGSVSRNSPYALRNPIFSAALRTPPPAPGKFTNSPRDLVWRFSVRGGFTNQGVNLASATTAVVPQSMAFIDSIGRLAVVDGSSQGLVLISLDSITVAGTFF